MQRILVSTQRRAAAASAAASRRSSSHTTRCFSAAVEEDTNNDDNRFSIRGTFREGRASYLDTSATTPMDPRVLDKIMPFMVSRKKNLHMNCNNFIFCAGSINK